MAINYRSMSMRAKMVAASVFIIFATFSLSAFSVENAVRLELDPAHIDPVAAGLVDAPPEEQERRIEQILVNRKIRDVAFRRAVIDAYDVTCAVTGLRIINGGGKAEAQAAHIWSVADGGPDVVQNGIALSATAHWLFLTDACSRKSGSTEFGVCDDRSVWRRDSAAPVKFGTPVCQAARGLWAHRVP